MRTPPAILADGRGPCTGPLLRGTRETYFFFVVQVKSDSTSLAPAPVVDALSNVPLAVNVQWAVPLFTFVGAAGP